MRIYKNKVVNWISGLRDIIRWREWYDSKIPFFFVCMFYAAASSRPSTEVDIIIEIFFLLLTLCLYASLGYIVNSYYDRKCDKAVFKQNQIALVSDAGGKLILSAVIAINLLGVTVIYLQQTPVLLLFFLAIVVAFSYSMPPMRLKERGMLGLMAPSIAQRTLPVIIIFEAMDAWNFVAVLICVLSSLVGLRYIIVHQIKDIDRDRISSVHTLATRNGINYMEGLLMKVVFPLELIILLAVLILMSLDFPVIGLVSGTYIALAIMYYLPVSGLSTIKSSITSYGLLEDFYCLYWPILMLAVMVENNYLFYGLLLFTFIWLFRRLKKHLKFLIRVMARARYRIS